MSEEPHTIPHQSDLGPTSGQTFLPGPNPTDPLKILKDYVHNPLDRLSFQHGVRELSEQTIAVEALTNITREVERLRYESTHDALTGVYNRAGIEAKARELEKAGNIIGVIFLDLDRFKPVNDALGHDEGDKALIAAGGVITSSVREGDFVGRWGGDEFIALINLSGQRRAYSHEDTEQAQTPKSAADEIAHRLDAHFQLFMLTKPEFEKAGLGYSMGWGIGPTFDEARLKADAEMYNHKEEQKIPTDSR